MNKLEFVQELSRRLAALPKIEAQKQIAYYAEMINDRIDDGMTEQEAVAALGNLDELVRQAYLDQSMGSLVKEKMSTAGRDSQNKWLWLTIIVLSSPVWFPLLMAAGGVVFGFYVAMWSIMFALVVTVAALMISGVVAFVGGLIMLFVQGPATGMFIMGGGLMLIGISLLLVIPVYYIIGAIVALTKWMWNKLKSLLIKKEVIA